jgi:hypothetical protein
MLVTPNLIGGIYKAVAATLYRVEHYLHNIYSTLFRVAGDILYFYPRCTGGD